MVYKLYLNKAVTQKKKVMMIKKIKSHIYCCIINFLSVDCFISTESCVFYIMH